MTSKSTNQKTIGINKHGTLLSSQTTEAPGTKHNPQGPHHRSGATFLTYPPNPTPSNPPFRAASFGCGPAGLPLLQGIFHDRRVPDFGRESVALTGGIHYPGRGDSEDITRPSGAGQIGPERPQNSANTREQRPQTPPGGPPATRRTGVTSPINRVPPTAGTHSVPETAPPPPHPRTYEPTHTGTSPSSCRNTPLC
jgi:hypothetical protein